MDVYDPAQIDKRGGRYGFVKFMKVADVEDLEKRLQQIWIGTFKLRVQRSRSRGDVRVSPPQRTVRGPAATKEVSNDRRYAYIVTGNMRRGKNGDPKRW